MVDGIHSGSKQLHQELIKTKKTKFEEPNCIYEHTKLNLQTS